MLTQIRTFLARFRSAIGGLSAIEFAIILPVMLTSLLGAVEVSNGMLADRKVTQTTSTLADLVSQDNSVTNAEINDIFAAAVAVMHPINATGMRMRISSVVADANGITRVAWSDARNMSARAVNSTITVPAGMVAANGSVILTEVELNYSSSFGEFLTNGVTLQDKFYLRPRRTLKIARVAS
jgi:Flp pilus assembly protein TadG